MDISREAGGTTRFAELTGPEFAQFDRFNLRGQPVPDGRVTHEDVAQWMSRPAWEAFCEHAQRLPAEEAARLLSKRLEQARSHQPAPARKETLTKALDTLRDSIAFAQEASKRGGGRGLQVVYPVQTPGGQWVAGAALHGKASYVVKPSVFDELKPSPKERDLLFSKLVTETERVVKGDGTAHYLTPATRRILDDAVSALRSEIGVARQAGKKIIYLSTPIGSPHLKTNLAIADWVERKVKADRTRWGDNVHVINPATWQRRLPKDLHGNDYMYMWHTLLNLDLFDIARFTKRDDTVEFFRQHNFPLPPDYVSHAGDLQYSSGCRDEWNIFVELNRKKSAQGVPNHHTMMFYGDNLAAPDDHTRRITRVDYSKVP
ncbi:MAG: hypothetical protein AAF219_00265 [Myxococcota bacterium]